MASARAALFLLDALRRGGLSHVVICPGSRSAPLTVAAALLEKRGLRLHTALDERSAAFFALGLGRAQGRPAAVITTSGTAVANLLPAVVEADLGTIPLLLLSADRPARLKGCGANQSVNQEDFLSSTCRWVGQGDSQSLARMALDDLEALAAMALGRAQGRNPAAPPGPVHLNLPFEEPLHPTGAEILALVPEADSAGCEGIGLPRGPLPSREDPPPPSLDPDRPGVVVAGPWRGRPCAWEGHLDALRQWHRRTGWPVLADALSGLRGVPGLPVVGGYDLILESAATVPAAGQVIRLGSLPASRRLQRWLSAQNGTQVLISEGDPRPLDPLAKVSGQWCGGLATWLAADGTGPGGGFPGGRAGESVAAAVQGHRWSEAEAAIQALLERELESMRPELDASEPWLARRLAAVLPAGLPVMLANSSPVRDWESFVDPAAPWRPVFSFRGASGIDGTLSSACGLAEALGRLVLVSGDLALLHDGNGWLWHRQLRGRLTVVVIENQGGGIFEQLPIRTAPPDALDFERLFAMPQPVDPCALAAVHGIPGRRVRRRGEVEAALVWALEQPLALVAVRTDRRADAALRQRLRTMAAAELRESPALP